MKKISLFLTFLIILLFTAGIVNALSNPYLVQGKTTLNGNIANSVQVRLTNLATGESQDFISTSEADYGFNLANYPKEYARNQQIKLTYCISDTRCKEKSTTLTITGDYLIQNLDAKFEPAGNYPPFVIYGDVYIDGIKLTTGKVKLEDLTQASSYEMDIKVDGYQFNLANLPGGYNTGDKIRLTYLTNVYEFFVAAGSQKYDFQITSESPTTTISGGGSSGGGWGIPGDKGAEKPLIQTGIDAPGEQISVLGIEGRAFGFSIAGASHSVLFKDIQDDRVTYEINSEPFEVTLLIGETKDVDTNRNGLNDFRIILNSIVNKQADTTFKILTEEQTPELTTTTTTEEGRIIPIESPEQGKKSNIGWIIGAVIIILGIVAYFLFKKPTNVRRA